MYQKIRRELIMIDNLKKTYAQRLEVELQKTEPTRVINASIIGFSSDQGKRLALSLIPLIRSSLVVFAYGINDIDRHRFYFQSNMSDDFEFDNLPTRH